MAFAYESSTSSANRILAQESARIFMAKVYRWMFGGLALTGLVAMYVASQPNLALMAARNVWPLIILELGAVFALSFLGQRMSGLMAGGLFLAYAALNGVTFSGIFYAYQLGSIANAFFLTAFVFGAMSVYGTVTKRDLSTWGSFLFVGLIGVLGASILLIFVHSSMLAFVVNCAMVVVFAGLAAYDQQKLRRLHASSGFSSATSLAVVGALHLYLDFINLFIAMLRLFGDRRR